jgi:hypothetical protein
MLPFGLCSWLGPRIYLCPRCKSPYDSGRLEWAEMTGKRKSWYIGVSVLYTGMLGFIGGVSIAGGVHFLRSGPWKWEVPFGTIEQGMGTIVCMLLIAAVQISRVFRSLNRTQYSDAATPEEAAFWLGPQGLALSLIFVPATLGWLIAWLLS